LLLLFFPKLYCSGITFADGRGRSESDHSASELLGGIILFEPGLSFFAPSSSRSAAAANRRRQPQRPQPY
jgi:hypothetical protein